MGLGVQRGGLKGIVFAYDEAQNLADHAEKEQFPLSLLLDVFQSLQKQGLPVMLLLTGQPTLFPKLVEARTFADRMFHVMFLDRLDHEPSRAAIEEPLADSNCPVRMDRALVDAIVELSGGYPYFIQFISREVFDVFLQGQTTVPVREITRKLDTDLFAGRWAQPTDRQRELLTVVSHLDRAAREFTVQEIREKSLNMKEEGALEKPFNPSSINQLLAKLSDEGLIYKNRHGKYSFAIPLLDRFIRRQPREPATVSARWISTQADVLGRHLHH